MAPGDDDDPPAWRADPGELAHKARLIRHVLPALQAPDEVEGGIREGLQQGVGHLHAGAALLTCNMVSPFSCSLSMRMF